MHDERHLSLIHTDHRRLVRAAARLLGPAEAEDAVQDAYVRALEGEGASPTTAQAWLLTVVRHLAIDRLRRRQWLQQWLAQTAEVDGAQISPSAETDAARAQAVTQMVRLLAARLTPAEGAAVLLHEVFDASHAELALASGRSEAGSRQQLRRALLRLRQSRDTLGRRRPSVLDKFTPPDQPEEAVFRLYLQALQWCDPQALWAMLTQPATRAQAARPALVCVRADAPSAPPITACGVMQVGGQLGLVVTLDGVTLCVLPLGVRAEADPEMAVR